MSGSVDLQFFIPAESSSEAVSRIYSLTGASERGRGEKRALVALRDALRLDIDVTRTNADLGERIASRLDVAWEPQLHVRRTKVNLDGLNVLLEGAQLAFQEGSLQRVRPALPAGLEASGWAAFNPAVSKIEAVTRIAGLTGAPAESLGPGSKERKSVLVNLADNLLPQARLDRSSKTRLARDLAHELGMTWTDTCYSTGETVSLEGLNVVLAGAERRLGRLGSSAAELLTSAEAEAQALVAALADGLPAGPWDGRKSVQWMAREGARGAHENEWQGWYYEARGRKVLQDSFTPSRKPVQVRYGNTTFDYSLNYVWDLKSHTSGAVEPGRESKRSSGTALLNDHRAIRQCVEDQGLGFLVLSGAAEMDHDGTFREWHRDFKRSRGVRSSPSNSGRSRMRKRGFEPRRLEAFWIRDTPHLDAALAAGQLAVRPIGRQPPRTEGDVGAERQDKIEMRIPRARAGLLVAQHAW